jgi:hypothetical protein
LKKINNKSHQLKSDAFAKIFLNLQFENVFQHLVLDQKQFENPPERSGKKLWMQRVRGGGVEFPLSL